VFVILTGGIYGNDALELLVEHYLD